MGKKKRKIIERLDALERMARKSLKRGRHDERGPQLDHRDLGDCGEDRGECEFEEKRVIDTVTRLVTERVGRIIQKEAEKRDGGNDRRDERDRDRDGDERRGDRSRCDGGSGDRGGDDRRGDGRRGGDERRDGGRRGGDEKRMVDLLVGLISEHVQEIVATELDLRLGSPRDHFVEVPEESRREPSDPE